MIFAVILRVSDPASGLTFRGFFIQARLVADDSDIGGFIYPVNGEYRLSSCSPPTVSLHCSYEPLKSWVFELRSNYKGLTQNHL